MFKDLVRVTDFAVGNLRTKLGELVAGREFGDSGKSVVEVHGWVKLLMRERGKIVRGSHREGHNVWTNTGREYLPLLMSYSAAATPFRSDRVSYLGVGTSSFIEDAGVLHLANPVAYVGSTFLAPLIVGAGEPSFPLTPTRTTVRYRYVFGETEITTTPGSQVFVSELGLFTDGDPLAGNAVGRNTSLAVAGPQAPVAYKSFEPVGKTSALELEVAWEIRF